MAETFFGKTDPGKQRQKNEDTFIAQAVTGTEYIVACVIDGVGGYAGGEVAAEIARNTIIGHLDNLPGDITAIMRNALSVANDEIFSEKKVNARNEQMACVVTMTIADPGNNKFYYAHVGDTRLYLFRDNSLVKITRDHSIVGFLEESGRLTEDAAMHHPKRNEINKALGFEEHVSSKADFVDTGESPFLPGDILLLCSDGLSDMIGSNEITSILKQSTELSIKAAVLIDAANKAGGKDNITVALIRNNNASVQHVATKPAAVANKNGTGQLIEQAEVKKKESNLQNDQAIRKPGKGRNLVAFLVFLCIVLACALVWAILKDSALQRDINDTPVTETTRNVTEQRFADSLKLLNGNLFSLNLPDSQKTIIISDTILITRDSMHINGNGISLISDSAYHGPVFVMGPACSYLAIENLDFQNFDVAMILREKGVGLSNVHFINCKVPILYQFQFPFNGAITGRLADTLFHFRDSVIN
ncbi:MAG: protein phosphatase 2C domain-containing protein [Chitinophagaceae bacterium]